MTFSINGERWSVRFEPPDSALLMRSDGSLSIAVTDDALHTIFVSDAISGQFLRKVMTHEICHAFSFSYGLHIPIEIEEQIADFLASYGRDIIRTADEIFSRLVKIA